MAAPGALDDWLAQAQRFGPLYRNGLSNHLPMGLTSLYRLGASDDDMQRFHAHESAMLQLLAAGAPPRIPQPDSATPHDFPAYLAFFSAQIASHGAAAMVRAWLPRLMPGVAASAFHGLIRLAYALDAGNDMETAHALASWCSEFADLRLPGTVTDAVTDDPIEVIAATLSRRYQQHQQRAPGQGIIIDNMVALAASAVVQQAVLQPASIRLPDLARFSLAAFAAQDNFTLLHLVTASHALRLMLPFCVGQEAALRSFWGAALVAYLTVQVDTEATPAPQVLGVEPVDWPAAFARARQSNDAHTIKLAYTAYCEYLCYGDDRYHGVVLRRLRQGQET